MVVWLYGCMVLWLCGHMVSLAHKQIRLRPEGRETQHKVPKSECTELWLGHTARCTSLQCGGVHDTLETSIMWPVMFTLDIQFVTYLQIISVLPLVFLCNVYQTWWSQGCSTNSAVSDKLHWVVLLIAAATIVLLQMSVTTMVRNSTIRFMRRKKKKKIIEP